MSTLDNILGLLNKWPTWKHITEAPDKIDALERRVAELEAALENCPAKGCPFCGKRAFRLDVVDMQGQREVWKCGECGKSRDIRHDLMRGGHDESFVQMLEVSGRALDDVRVPICFADGWYVMDPTTQDGEDGPALRYVSSESTQVAAPPFPNLNHACGLLRLLAKDHAKHHEIASINQVIRERYGLA